MADNYINELDDTRTRWAGRQTSELDCADRPSTEAEEGPARLLALIGGPGLNAQGNAKVRAATMQSAQKTHGNRAVQRFIQGTASPNPGTLAVQRYQGPDSDWMWNTFANAGSAATGLVGALPIVGNLLNAGVAGSQGVFSAASYAMGDKENAKFWAHQAQNNALIAIPIFGNIRSGAQGVHDAGAFYDNLFGGGSTPPVSSGQRYHRESGPKFDSWLSSLF